MLSLPVFQKGVLKFGFQMLSVELATKSPPVTAPPLIFPGNPRKPMFSVVITLSTKMSPRLIVRYAGEADSLPDVSTALIIIVDSPAPTLGIVHGESVTRPV